MLFDVVYKRIDSFDLPKDQGGPNPKINAGETWIFLNANSLVLSTRQRWPVVVGRCASRQPKKKLPVTKRSATWELISAEQNKVIKNQNRFWFKHDLYSIYLYMHIYTWQFHDYIFQQLL